MWLVSGTSSFGVTLDSSSCPPVTENKTRLLRKEERLDIKHSIDKEAVLVHVLTSTPKELVPSLFPERKEVWTSIKDTEKLKMFIINSIDRYIRLYDQYSKGKDKYAHFYLAWLDYIRSYTCKPHQTSETRNEWALVLSNHSPVSESTQRTVISCILHAVQESMQSQISSHIQERAQDNQSLDLVQKKYQMIQHVTEYQGGQLSPQLSTDKRILSMVGGVRHKWKTK